MLERLVITSANSKALTAQMVARAWSTLQVGTAIGTLLLLYILASFIGIFFHEEQIPLIRLLTTLLVHAVVMAAIALIVRQRKCSWSSSFGMGVRQLKTLALAPLFYLATLPLLMFALLLQQWLGIEHELQDAAKVIAQDVSWLRTLYILTAIIVAPLFEELLFRGILLPFLFKHTGPAGGIVLVSILFASMHFHLPSLAPLFLLSTMLGLVYWRTGSLWASIGTHAIFNTVSILAINTSG